MFFQKKEVKTLSKAYNLPCNIAKTLDIVGDRWTLLIVRELLKGKKRFTELKEALHGIAPNILSDRLRSLEQEEIVTSDLYVKHPPRFSYELTNKGKELRHVINALAIWGNKNFNEKYYEVVHSKCKHEVEMTYYCEHCEQTTNDLTYIALECERDEKEM